MGIFKLRRNRKLYGQFCKTFEKEVKELEQLGYYPFQIRDMIQSLIKGNSGRLSGEDQESIRMKLVQQIEFARKTIDLPK